MLDVGALLCRVADGDRLAFEILLTTFQARFLAVAEAITRNSASAEDAVQETFIRILRFAADADSRRDTRAWLFKICVNCARDVRARSLSRQSASLNEATCVADRATPLAYLLARERQAALSDAIAELPSHLRTALVLRFTADLSYAEIARVLVVPVGTVKSRLHTALARLRRTVGRIQRL